MYRLTARVTNVLLPDGTRPTVGSGIYAFPFDEQALHDGEWLRDGTSADDSEDAVATLLFKAPRNPLVVVDAYGKTYPLPENGGTILRLEDGRFAVVFNARLEDA